MVAIIDYGAGNLRSVQKAFEYIGEDARVVSDFSSVVNADRVVLPGNGAFGDCIKALKTLGLTDAIARLIESGRPFLGICIGMQLLFDKSFEFGEHEGLKYIPGTVKRFSDDVLKAGFKIPHTGWNRVKIEKKCALFDNIPDNSPFYFVHSYYAEPALKECVAATCDYCGNFTASVIKDNIYAVQFHPEKSWKAGLQLIKNFCKL